MLAFPARVSAPLAVASRTMIDWLIVIVLAVVLLARKLLLPEYETLIEWEPAVRAAVLKVATPPASVIVPRSSLVVVSKKSTLPAGVPEPGEFAVTVAVTVTVWPRGTLVDETAGGGRARVGADRQRASHIANRVVRSRRHHWP